MSLPPWLIISIHHQAGLDCNQYYHLLWLPDCSGRKTEQCAERRGESSRGFGVDRAAGYRFEQGRSGDRTVHSPSPPQRSQPLPVIELSYAYINARRVARPTAKLFSRAGSLCREFITLLGAIRGETP